MGLALPARPLATWVHRRSASLPGGSAGGFGACLARSGTGFPAGVGFVGVFGDCPGPEAATGSAADVAVTGGTDGVSG